MDKIRKLINSSNAIVNVNGYEFGGKDKIIISGPCSFGNYEELYKIVKELKKLNINFIRAGAFKFRTSPYSFQGLRDEGIEILLKIKKELDINIVVELLDTAQVNKYGELIDIIQIGSRNMYNTELLKEVGKLKTPVILKRGMCATYNEWLLAASYILKEGNNNIILCERGIRSAVTEGTRNVLDIQAIPYIKKYSKFPIIVDPSHASGLSYMVVPMSKACLIAGADGLLIETHYNPKLSLSDKNQTISIKELKEIVKFNNEFKINNNLYNKKSKK